MLINDSYLREVSTLGNDDLKLVRAFMQGAIYSWLKNRKGEPFAVRDLVGGDNADWNGTCLQALFDEHSLRGKSADEAFSAAAQDLGWIVKTLLHDDKRSFAVDQTELINYYRWV